MQLPPKSPHLHPVQHCWDVIEWEICVINVPMTNFQRRRDIVLSTSSEIAKEICDNLGEINAIKN